MRLRRTSRSPGTLFSVTPIWTLLTLLVLFLFLEASAAYRPPQLASWRKETEDLFYHGYENYMKHAFPEDELRPISCKPLTRDRNNNCAFRDQRCSGKLFPHPHRQPVDPGSARFLSFEHETKQTTAAVPEWRESPSRTIWRWHRDIQSGIGARARGFDLDSKVQVFETAIRGLGGLLSAHLFAVGDLPIRGYSPDPEDAAPLRKSRRAFRAVWFHWYQVEEWLQIRWATAEACTRSRRSTCFPRSGLQRVYPILESTSDLAFPFMPSLL